MTTFRQPGTVVADHTFLVPLDHARPDGPQLELFARSVTAAAPGGADRPWLVFLQGGPGFGAPRPVGRELWLDRALEDYRVLLLDQRGTGQSTPATRQTLASLGSAAAIAAYLSHFRADSIVLDAELVRRTLTGGEPWSVLGQSFGGFCTVSYLSFAPHGLREAFITGGLPGLTATADDVYRLTYPEVARRNALFYSAYPSDAALVREIWSFLTARPDVRLPSGAPLTLAAFRALGGVLGQHDGAHVLHYLLEGAFTPDRDELSDAFLAAVQARLSFASAPLYAVLHEGCYAQGSATGWAAARLLASFPEFDFDADPPLFTGEMIYPWMFETDPALAPLRDAAFLLAAKDDWPPLYDPSRLAANEVPAAAAVYYHDMYVPRELSVRTAAAVRGLKPWITSEHEHDGLRVTSGKVLGHLIGMVRGEI
jgi:pimeloyl-ACP methyl ester carboxylesterase